MMYKRDNLEDYFPPPIQSRLLRSKNRPNEWNGGPATPVCVCVQEDEAPRKRVMTKLYCWPFICCFHWQILLFLILTQSDSVLFHCQPPHPRSDHVISLKHVFCPFYSLYGCFTLLHVFYGTKFVNSVY